MTYDLAMRLRAMGNPEILVFGDLCIDTELHGRIDRHAAEAPHCPVFQIERDRTLHGGAGAVAKMLDALGCKVSFCYAYPTVNKVRHFVGGVQVWRHDVGPTNYHEKHKGKEITELLKSIQKGPACVLIADYGFGTCTKENLERVFKEARIRHIPVIVDPAKGTPWEQYAGASIIKCNRQEFGRANAKRWQDRLSKDCTIIVTKGNRGMDLRRPGEEIVSIDPYGTHVADVTGAGDMVLAAIGLAQSAGFGLEDCCKVAVVAAGTKVAYRGAVGVPRARVILELMKPSKVLEADMGRLVRDAYMDAKIVFCPGVFRLPTAHHAHLLQWAKTQGDIVVVGMNDDESAARLRPDDYVMGFNERSHLIGSVHGVHFVIPFSGDTPEALILDLQPDIQVKGPDYANREIECRDLVMDTRIAPEGPTGDRHATMILREIVGR